jgi:hypothetical protein
VLDDFVPFRRVLHDLTSCLEKENYSHPAVGQPRLSLMNTDSISAFMPADLGRYRLCVPVGVHPRHRRGRSWEVSLHRPGSESASCYRTGPPAGRRAGQSAQGPVPEPCDFRRQGQPPLLASPRCPKSRSVKLSFSGTPTSSVARLRREKG